MADALSLLYPPRIARVASGQKAKPVAHSPQLGLGVWQEPYDAAADCYVQTCLLRLREVPTGERVEVLSGFVATVYTLARAGHQSRGAAPVPALAWRATLREAGQNTPRVPKVSRFCPLKLQHVDFKMQPLNNTILTRRLVVDANCRLASSEMDDEPAIVKLRAATQDAYLEDAAGTRWKCTTVTFWRPFLNPTSDWDKSEKAIPSFIFDEASLNSPLPKKLDGLTFRALISVGDHWPLEVRVPVRDIQ